MSTYIEVSSSLYPCYDQNNLITRRLFALSNKLVLSVKSKKNIMKIEKETNNYAL